MDIRNETGITREKFFQDDLSFIERSENIFVTFGLNKDFGWIIWIV